jgi:riboflavin synthase
MFTGLIQTTGEVREAQAADEGVRLTVAPTQAIGDLAIGESIAVCGVCLTAEPDSRPDRLRFFMSRETLERTRLAALRPGARVNLERSLRPDDRMGGHLVMGHVDGVGEIERLERQGEGWLLGVRYPGELSVFLAPKGSIAVDGMSLTLVDVERTRFTSALIPHTVEATLLKWARAGDRVNLEIDMLARYVVRALEAMERRSGRLTTELLAQAGFHVGAGAGRA